MVVAPSAIRAAALVAADPPRWLAALFTGLGAAAGVLTISVVRLFVGEPEPFVLCAQREFPIHPLQFEERRGML